MLSFSSSGRCNGNNAAVQLAIVIEVLELLCECALGTLYCNYGAVDTLTSTPAGIAMGFLPILDISTIPPLPDEREDFAADIELASLLCQS